VFSGFLAPTGGEAQLLAGATIKVTSAVGFLLRSAGRPGGLVAVFVAVFAAFLTGVVGLFLELNDCGLEIRP